MPKKRNQIPYTKPQTSAHHSIAGPRNSHINNNDSSTEQASQKSVNDLLQHLRIAQAPSSAQATEPRSDVNPKTLHPSISDILQIPATPPPRPRPGMRPFATPGRRRPPGPAPPRSWLENNHRNSADHGRRSSTRHSNLASDQHPYIDDLDPLPDTHLPHPRSLMHLTFLHLARNWDVHVEYDQHYLATLPVRHKQTLLFYIAKYSPNGIDLHGLMTLFQDESTLDFATGAEGLTHLDLSASIGRSFSLKELKHFIATISTSKYPASSSSVPESWEDDDDVDAESPVSSASASIPSVLPSRTSTLTHLSLSHPHPSSCHTNPWRALIALTSTSLPTLTHLSLAHWPPPSLHPNSATAYTASPATGAPSVAYAPTNYYSHALDRDFSGAAAVLRQLSRGTYCLRWLDVSGCAEWVPALAWRKGGVEWSEGAWAGVERVRVAQGGGGVPGCFVRGSMQEEEGSRWTWRALLAYRGDPVGDPGEREAARALRAWLDVELELEEAIARVSPFGVERGIGVGDEEGWEGEGDEVSWRDAGTRRTSTGTAFIPRSGLRGAEAGDAAETTKEKKKKKKQATTGRRAPLVFDRGWTTTGRTDVEGQEGTMAAIEIKQCIQAYKHARY